MDSHTVACTVIAPIVLYVLQAVGAYFGIKWPLIPVKPDPTPTPGPAPVVPTPDAPVAPVVPTPAPAPVAPSISPAVQSLLLALQAMAARTSTPIDDIALQVLLSLARQMPQEATK